MADCTTSGELYIDDQLIASMEIDDQPIDYLYIDDVCVWAALLPGQIIFDVPGTYQWEIQDPALKEIDLCMVGGGGSGATCDETSHNPGGGYAGSFHQSTETVTLGEIIDITVPLGGPGVDASDGSARNGVAGDAAIFRSITANGGAGGSTGGDYRGNGASHEGCDGVTYNDGTASDASNSYGGQASMMGSGGQGGLKCGTVNRDAGAGGPGAGGGGMNDKCGSGSYYPSGEGGPGMVIVRWGGYDPNNPTRRSRGVKVSEASPEDLARLGITKIN